MEFRSGDRDGHGRSLILCSVHLFFVLIWTYVLDHYPTGRLKDDPVLVSWQRQSDFDLKNVLVFHAVHDVMYPNEVPRAFGGKTATQTLHHT